MKSWFNGACFSRLPKSIYDFHTTSQNVVQRLVYSSTSRKPSAPDSLESVIHCNLAMQPVNEADALGRLEASCSIGWKSHLNVLIPDKYIDHPLVSEPCSLITSCCRNSDLRFTAHNLSPLPDEQCPINLKQYIARMHET